VRFFSAAATSHPTRNSELVTSTTLIQSHLHLRRQPRQLPPLMRGLPAFFFTSTTQQSSTLNNLFPAPLHREPQPRFWISSSPTHTTATNKHQLLPHNRFSAVSTGVTAYYQLSQTILTWSRLLVNLLHNRLPNNVRHHIAKSRAYSTPTQQCSERLPFLCL
jgi:hypothetical protein